MKWIKIRGNKFFTERSCYCLLDSKGKTRAEIDVDKDVCFEVFIGEGSINGEAKTLKGAKIIAEALFLHSTGVIND